jgi:ATP-binding cassette subfamily F protein 3
MADLLQVQSAAKAYGPKVLFDDATFAIGEGEHVGVIGPNGAGKTTLFRALIDEGELDRGQIIRSRSLRLGYLPQHDAWSPGMTVEDFLADNSQLPLWDLKQLSHGLGLTPAHFERPVTSLSGGYRMRVKLLKLLSQEPNIMLLDEPTNYLDLETLVVLENFLQGYPGAFLLISHDREFLRRVTTHTLEIEQGEITKYPGNIDDYFEQKALLREQLSARAQSLADKRKQILDFVARFGAKATKASQAQSRLKTLAKMDSIELKPLPVRARIRIPPPARTGKLVLDLKAVSMGYGSNVVLRGVDLQASSGEHIAVVGLNGAGKSTLLKTLAGDIPALSGTLTRGYQVTVGYYAQHVSEKLNLEHTVIEALESRAHPDVVRQEVLDLAGSLLFSGEDTQKRISVLSGGERARVALGQILLEKSSVLILDEPTNHLDFDTVEALTQALMQYEGSVIVVSHDRSFTRRVGTKILEIDQGEVYVHLGSYDDYVWRVQNNALRRAGMLEETPSTQSPLPKEGALSANAQYREQKKAIEREIKQLEKIITLAETRIAELQLELERARRSESIEELNRIQITLHPLEEQWLSDNEQLELKRTELQELMRKHL